nr:MAG TPA: hypothetical protein [Caudoviricetes sp.]
MRHSRISQNLLKLNTISAIKTTPNDLHAARPILRLFLTFLKTLTKPQKPHLPFLT